MHIVIFLWALRESVAISTKPPPLQTAHFQHTCLQGGEVTGCFILYIALSFGTFADDLLSSL